MKTITIALLLTLMATTSTHAGYVTGSNAVLLVSYDKSFKQVRGAYRMYRAGRQTRGQLDSAMRRHVRFVVTNKTANVLLSRSTVREWKTIVQGTNTVDFAKFSRFLRVSDRLIRNHLR